MPPDDPFEPKLGRIRAQTPKAPKSFRGKVIHAVSRAGGRSGVRNGSMVGGKFGRGAGVARVVSSGAPKGARARRAVVKARIVKLAGKGAQAAAAHLRYLQRDGVTRNGQKGELYGPQLDRVDAKDFMSRCEGDRHQFRFIVSPEDAGQYDSLKELTRKVMVQVEQDVGTRLDWVAVDHFNTGHPHTHIIVRGRDDQGKDLIIAPEYMKEGFRERVQAQVSLDLGPRSDMEIASARRVEVTQERLTSIDRQLLRDADDMGRVQSTHVDGFTQTLRTGRLVQLERFGLAEPIAAGQWRLREDMEQTLRRMGERGDIIKSLHQSLTARGIAANLAEGHIHDGIAVIAGKATAVTGRLVERGLADELTDRHYVVVETLDGRIHYADIGAGDRTAPLPSGAILQLTPNKPEVRPADLTIAEVARSSDGYYSVEAHLRFDRSARQSFAETHARRLEAIRRTTGGVTRDPDGRFLIGPDYIEKALEFEMRAARQTPMKVDVLSDKSLVDQIRYPGVTWLDYELAAERKVMYGQAGFGREVRTALGSRMQWLIEEGIASAETPLGAAALANLRNRELKATADQVAKEMGKSYATTRPGDQIEGILRKGIVIGGRKYAVVDRGQDFTLVPWRPVLEKHIDKTVSGLYRESGINWTVSRGHNLDRSI